jgi:hypothetical protein
VALGTAAITVFFARTAGVAAYARVASKLPLEQYLRRERIWAAASILIAVIFIALATWYNLAWRTSV